jgi:nucleotide-binding universal stress UspA family protein
MPADAGSNEPKWIEVSGEKDWDEVRKLFALSLHTLGRAGLDADLMIRRGDAAQEIIEQAESWGANSIFLGAKGVRGIERLLMGSVSSSVAARAHCSVEVVRP